MPLDQVATLIGGIGGVAVIMAIIVISDQRKRGRGEPTTRVPQNAQPADGDDSVD